MTILVTGDIHGEHSIRKFSSRKMQRVLCGLDRGLTKDDYLIITGDFGLIWDAYETRNERYWLDWLDEKPWTTLFVDGNHENHERLNNWPVDYWNGGNVHMITNSVIHLMRGQVFNLQGNKFFTMGGAASHDIIYRTPGLSWWPEEIPNMRERDEAVCNLENHNWKVDYVITHDAPTSIANQLIYTRDRSTDYFTDWLEFISEKLDFNQWFFGHHHKDIELNDGKYQAMYSEIAVVR